MNSYIFCKIPLLERFMAIISGMNEQIHIDDKIISHSASFLLTIILSNINNFLLGGF